MPRGDKTGPMGMGPGTGRRLGYCAGFDAPGYMNDAGGGPGRPGGHGRQARWGQSGGGRWGAGRGWRHGQWANPLPVRLEASENAEIRRSLSLQLEAVVAQLGELRQQLAELERREGGS